MKPKMIKKNARFIGRRRELETLAQIDRAKESAILVVYGRRRVGKTELLEQAFRKRNILKFEGIEGKEEREQMEIVLAELSKYAEEPLLTKIKPNSWREVFELIARYVKEGIWTLYFEEVQWLAQYGDSLIAEFKYVWDNELRYNPRLIVIFCGSSPSFVIGKVIKSKALYNRSIYELPLQEFSLIETKKFLKNRSDHEVLDAYLSVGGVPEYLKWMKKESSVFLSLCKHSFSSGSFFSHEYERIFVSQLASNKNYRKIIEFLSRRSFARRGEILKHLKTETGGTLTNLLLDLEICSLIERYHPVDRTLKSHLARYCIKDPYLQFYFKFIKPVSLHIAQGMYNRYPKQALKMDTYRKWLGFTFERMCRSMHFLIAKALGFEGVAYRSGSYFNRKAPGFQIDLVFDREDRVYTVCEIKYREAKIGTSVISEFEKKLQFFKHPSNRTVRKVLICINGADQALKKRAYFDRILNFKDLFLSPSDK